MNLPEDRALPCGGTAVFDTSSGIGYRCDTCFAVVGSVGMPRQCKKLLDEEKAAVSPDTGLNGEG